MNLSAAVNKNQLIAVAVVAVAGLALWLAVRGFGGVAKDVTSAAVNVAGGAVSGVVVGVGEAVGLPDTNQDQCSLDIAAGDYWAASISCPAKRFIQFAAGNKNA